MLEFKDPAVELNVLMVETVVDENVENRHMRFVVDPVKYAKQELVLSMVE